MSLQQHEIGLEACPPRRPRNPIAGVPENCNIEFGVWKPNTYSFRIGDQVGWTMDKEVRRSQKIHLALAIAEGESVNAWAQRIGVPERTACRWAQDPKVRREEARRRGCGRPHGPPDLPSGSRVFLLAFRAARGGSYFRGA
jgi:hypothetical protein